jgi:hypothetical protein
MGFAAAAAIGGAASLGGALLTSNASNKAAQEQLQGTQQAIAAQKQMFGQAQGALSPYYTAGSGQSLATLQSLINPSTAASTLSQLPGFQFTSGWGTKSAENALAAEGLGGSTGPLASAVSQYNTGLAQQYWGQDVGALQNLVNTGAGAAGALAGNATAAGQGIANSSIAGGNALASGTLGSANAIAGGLTNGAGSVSNSLVLSALLGSGGGAGGLYGGGGTQSGLNSLFSSAPGQGLGSFASA